MSDKFDIEPRPKEESKMQTHEWVISFYLICLMAIRQWSERANVTVMYLMYNSACTFNLLTKTIYSVSSVMENPPMKQCVCGLAARWLHRSLANYYVARLYEQKRGMWQHFTSRYSLSDVCAARTQSLVLPVTRHANTWVLPHTDDDPMPALPLISEHIVQGEPTGLQSLRL